MKFILFGDDFLASSYGWGEFFVARFFLSFPEAEAFSSIYGNAGMGCREALEEAPHHIIGKAPDVLVLGLGYKELSNAEPLEEALVEFGKLLELVLLKTNSHLYLCNVPNVLFTNGSDAWNQCRNWNSGLAQFIDSRVQVIDFSTSCEEFVNRHRAGPGEKRGLHKSGGLTTMGRLLLSDLAFSCVEWPKHLQPMSKEI